MMSPARGLRYPARRASPYGEEGGEGGEPGSTLGDLLGARVTTGSEAALVPGWRPAFALVPAIVTAAG